MFNLVIKQSQTVEAVFEGSVAAGRRYSFREVPNISRNNLVLYGIEAFSATQLSTSPLGKTVIAAADTDQILVTLKDTNNEEFIYQMPYYNLIRSNVGGFITVLEPRVINLTDCYVELTDTTGVAADESCVFNLYYDIIGG